MVVYVAFIALLNIALGYALAVYMGASRRPSAARYGAGRATRYSEDHDEGEYDSDDSYDDYDDDQEAVEDEYESAVN